MDFAAWIQAVGTVGFPIIAFFVAVYALKYSFDKSMEGQRASMDKIGALTEAVNENTKTLALLVQKMEKRDDGR